METNLYKYFSWAVLVSIALMPFIVNPFGALPFELPKHIWMLFSFGVSTIFFVGSLLKSRYQEVVIEKKFLKLLGFWLLTLMFSTIFSLAWVESFWGVADYWQGFFTMVYLAVFFIYFIQVFQEKKHVKAFFEILIIVGSVVSLHAILQKLGYDPLQLIGLRGGSKEAFNERSFATLGHPNILGQWLIFPTITSIYFFREKSKNIWCWVATFICVFGLFTTLNRASIAGVIFSFSVIFCFEVKSKTRKRVAIIALIMATVVFGYYSFFQRSFQSRITLWQNTIPLILERPILGFGPETFYQSIQTTLSKEVYETENLFSVPDRAHNVFLQTFYDSGMIGVVPLIILCLFLFGYLKKSSQLSTSSKITLTGLIAYGISLQLSFPLTTDVFIALGFLAIFVVSTQKLKKVRIHGQKSKVIVVIILIFLLCFSWDRAVRLLRADILFQQSLNTPFEEKERAFQVMQSALALNNVSSSMLLQSINFFATKENFQKWPMLNDQLNKNLIRAKSITNESFLSSLSSAKFNLAKGDKIGAYEDYRKVSQKAPNYAAVWLDWGLTAYDNKDWKMAQEKFEKLRDLAPSVWFLASEDPDKLRIFRKTHALFYYGMGKLLDVYKQSNQLEKAEELENLLQ